MKKRIQKLALALIGAGMLCTSLSMPVSAETTEFMIPEDAIAGGVVDEDCGQFTWFIDKDGELTVTGIGDFDANPSVSTPGRIPWYDYRESILTADVNITDMMNAANLFANCSNLTEVDLTDFETGSVINMTGLFRGCAALTEVDISVFDTNNVTGMGAMFEGCASLESLDLSGLDTQNVTKMPLMFSDCSSLKTLDISSFDTAEVTEMSSMFQGCTSLESLNLSGVDTGNVTDMQYMFDGCASLESLDLSGFETENVRQMGYMFRGCSALTELDLSNFDTSKVTTMKYMFEGCSSLGNLELESFNTANVLSMGRMFKDCAALKELDLSSFDTSSVGDMCYMFFGCTSLEKLDLNNFRTRNVISMHYMFGGCSSLETLDLSSFYSHQFLNVSQMFLNCSSLKVLDMRNFDFTENQRFGEKLFQGCLALRQIEVPTGCGKMIDLPKNSPTDVWKKPDGTVIEVLPMNLETSITIKKTEGETVVITDVFSDVYEDWYTEYVEYVYTHFLMSGIAGTKEFQPNVNITKAQVAQVLYNMRNKPSVQGDYRVVYELNDVYRSEWYIDAVAWAYNEQIVTGDSNTKMFYPNADVTREQLALMMYRYAKYAGLDTSKTSDLAGMKNAENVSNWAEEGVRWAVGSGLISGIEKNGIKDLAPQGNATRAQMAAILQRFCE